MPIVKVRAGIDLAYDRIGDPGDPCLVLVPGAGAPRDFFPDAFCHRLARTGLQVVRYSHRDTDASTHVEKPYPISELLTDLRALIDVLQLGQVHLAGHSMGGYLVALALSDADFPVRTGTLMAAGPSIVADDYARFGLTFPDDALWPKLMANTPTGDLEADWPGWVESWRVLHGNRPVEETLARNYTEALYRHDPRNCQVATHHIHAMSTVPADLPVRLGQIDRPALVIHGDEDPLVPVSHGRALARLIPHAGIVELAGAGHMYFNSATWSEIAAAIRPALSGNG